MSGALHDVARAALPVAVVLLILAGAARCALALELDDARTAYTARQYLPALSAWCLVAIAVYVVALGGAGEIGAAPLALAFGVGAAAVLVRAPEAEAPADEAEGPRPVPEARPAVAAAEARAAEPPAARPAEVPEARPPVAAPAARPAEPAAPVPAGRLWNDPAGDATPRTGLWSR